MRLEEVTKSRLRKIANSNLYVLRLRFLQLFAKYMGFEKREPLLKVEWKIFFKRYKVLSREFETRELKFNKRNIDKELEKTKKFFIKNLGGTLLVNIDNDSFLIDPILSKKDLGESVDYIIVTKKDEIAGISASENGIVKVVVIAPALSIDGGETEVADAVMIGASLASNSINSSSSKLFVKSSIAAAVPSETSK